MANKFHELIPRSGGKFATDGEPNNKKITVMIKQSLYERCVALSGDRFPQLLRNALEAYVASNTSLPSNGTQQKQQESLKATKKALSPKRSKTQNSKNKPDE